MIFKKTYLLFALILGFYGQALLAQDLKDEEAIKKVIQESYIEAIYNQGDTTAMRKGFHEQFELLGLQEDQGLRVVTLKDWIELVATKKKEGKYPPLKSNKVSVNFLRIDIVETVASAKIEFLVGGEVRYIDFLALYKFDEGWKIMNKVYYEIPK